MSPEWRAMLGWENVELFVHDIARKYHTVTSSVQHFYAQHFYAACFKCQSNEWLGVSSNHCHIREIFQISENFEFHGVSCLKKIILF